MIPTRAVAAAVVIAILTAGCASADPGEPIGQSSAASTFPNDKPAFDYFLGKGLTNFQAAGIVGNLDQESGVDPTAVQSGGPGRGIAQWSVGGRWDTDANDNAVWYAAQQGQDVYSLQLQLDFIWYELNTFSWYGFDELKATTNVTDATIVFETKFEGCGQCAESTRIAYAKDVLAEYGNDTVDGSTGDSGGLACTVTTTGESGECMDTAACAALGDHISTPGYCPGPANIQCCTAVDAGGAKDAADVPDAEDGSQPPDDAGSKDASADGSGHGQDAAAAEGGTHPDWQSSDSGGCAAARAGASGSDSMLMAGALMALCAIAGRRRRVK
jgi:hypothetical protein